MKGRCSAKKYKIMEVLKVLEDTLFSMEKAI
jgi:hypothetical protein